MASLNNIYGGPQGIQGWGTNPKVNSSGTNTQGIDTTGGIQAQGTNSLGLGGMNYTGGSPNFNEQTGQYNANANYGYDGGGQRFATDPSFGNTQQTMSATQNPQQATGWAGVASPGPHGGGQFGNFLHYMQNALQNGLGGVSGGTTPTPTSSAPQAPTPQPAVGGGLGGVANAAMTPSTPTPYMNGGPNLGNSGGGLSGTPGGTGAMTNSGGWTVPHASQAQATQAGTSRQAIDLGHQWGETFTGDAGSYQGPVTNMSPERYQQYMSDLQQGLTRDENTGFAYRNGVRVN
jgi:hypothetical protein